MEETKKDEKKTTLWEDIKVYFLALGIYLAISLVIGLFFIKHFRHFWISHRNAPLTEYVITGYDYDLEESHEYDDDGERVDYEDWTYYVKLKVNDENMKDTFKVEVDEDVFNRVYKDNATHLDEKEARFFYDGFRNKVFLGGHYSSAFIIFVLAFFGLFILLFIVFPYITRDKGSLTPSSPDLSQGEGSDNANDNVNDNK